jgi:hypothetical protein
MRRKLCYFNHRLCYDVSYRQYHLVSNNCFSFQTRILSLVGGHDLKSLVWNVMKELVGHDLSKHINMSGTKGKTRFRDNTNLVKTIFSKLHFLKIRYTKQSVQILGATASISFLMLFSGAYNGWGQVLSKIWLGFSFWSRGLSFR